MYTSIVLYITPPAPQYVKTVLADCLFRFSQLRDQYQLKDHCSYLYLAWYQISDELSRRFYTNMNLVVLMSSNEDE